MDLPSLENAIKALEKSLDSLGLWLTVWTALVVVGLIVEFAEDLKLLLTERPFKWRLFRTMVGGVLITIGVAGELFVQFRASKVETDLRTDSHEVEALLNEQAADANREAGNAKIEAGNAIKQAAQATRDAEVARRDAESFQLDIARANEHAAEANKKAEEERLARLKIEERLAPRRMSAQQTTTLVRDLKPLNGHRVTIFFISGDLEAATFVDQLGSAFKTAGLIVKTIPGMILGTVKPGISFDIGKNRFADADILANALINVSLANKPIPADKLPEEDLTRVDELQLVVGPKP
jgi:hypothetical protein